MPDHTPSPAGAERICFGLDRATDEESLRLFLHRFTAPPLLATLLPRLAEQEITAVVALLSTLLRQHLTDPEYHRLFLSDYLPHDKGTGKDEL